VTPFIIISILIHVSCRLRSLFLHCRAWTGTSPAARAGAARQAIRVTAMDRLEEGRLFVDLFVASELKTAAVKVWNRLDQVKDGTLTLADLEQLSQKVRINRPDAGNYWTADFWSNMLKAFDIDGNQSIDRDEFFLGLSRQLVDTELKREGGFESKTVAGLICEMRNFLNEALMSILKKVAYASCGGRDGCSDLTVLEKIFDSQILTHNDFGPVYELESKLKQQESDSSNDIITKLDAIQNVIRPSIDEAFDMLDGDANGFLNREDLQYTKVSNLSSVGAVFIRSE
jgi:hypothetical protein